MLAAQRRQLTNAEPRPGSQEDQRSPTILDGIDQRLDLSEREHRSLAGMLLSCPTDGAWVPSDEVVVYGRRADGAQEPVALGRCDLTRPVGAPELPVPGPDSR